MDLTNLKVDLALLEDLGFISNCPPNVNLETPHDDVSFYCDALNQLALSNGLCETPPFNSVLLNEPIGNYCAIYKMSDDSKSRAMDVLNAHADNVAKSFNLDRNWKK